LFHFVDHPTEALGVLQAGLEAELGAVTPAFAKSTTTLSRNGGAPPDTAPPATDGGAL
jgi:hypothetical protein